MPNKWKDLWNPDDDIVVGMKKLSLISSKSEEINNEDIDTFWGEKIECTPSSKSRILEKINKEMDSEMGMDSISPREMPEMDLQSQTLSFNKSSKSGSNFRNSNDIRETLILDRTEKLADELQTRRATARREQENRENRESRLIFKDSQERMMRARIKKYNDSLKNDFEDRNYESLSESCQTSFTRKSRRKRKKDARTHKVIDSLMEKLEEINSYKKREEFMERLSSDNFMIGNRLKKMKMHVKPTIKNHSDIYHSSVIYDSDSNSASQNFETGLSREDLDSLSQFSEYSNPYDFSYDSFNSGFNG